MHTCTLARMCTYGTSSIQGTGYIWHLIDTGYRVHMAPHLHLSISMVYIYIYTYTYIYIHIHMAPHPHLSISMIAQTFSSQGPADDASHIHTHIHTYIHACMHAYIHAYIHAYMHTCMQTFRLKVLPGMLHHRPIYIKWHSYLHLVRTCACV